MKWVGLGAIFPSPLVLCLPWSKPSALGLASSSSLHWPRATCKTKDPWIPIFSSEVGDSKVNQNIWICILFLTLAKESNAMEIPFQVYLLNPKSSFLSELEIIAVFADLPLREEAVLCCSGERQSNNWHSWKTCQQNRFLSQTEIYQQKWRSAV